MYFDFEISRAKGILTLKVKYTDGFGILLWFQNQFVLINHRG